MMNKIAIISSSVRDGRKSHAVALYFKNYLDRQNTAKAEILDLKKYNFPLFEERLKYQISPDTETVDFASKVNNADAVIIVTPEYNGGYPASLKNVIDLLYDEWQGKPVGIATVSDGPFGGSQAITALQFVLWKIGAKVVSARFPVPDVEKAFEAGGNPSDREIWDKRAKKFVGELQASYLGLHLPETS
jgi:NAD(P)H-dependent FMN reductase